MRTAIIRLRNGSESLLTRSVPELHAHCSISNSQRFELEVDTDGLLQTSNGKSELET